MGLMFWWWVCRIYNNRILLAGLNGIAVENVDEVLEDVPPQGSDDFGVGWAVNVSGNEVAMTGSHGIYVRDSGPTNISYNDVFMAGMAKV